MDIDEERFVEKRKQYLSTNDVGFSERVAEAAAWSNLGYSKSGIGKRMGRNEDTVDNYLDKARKTYPGILTQSVIDIDGDPEAPVSEIPDTPPEQCPVCLSEHTLVSGAMADDVFKISSWGATSMVEDAELACSFCHCVRLDGEWKRAETISSRAYTLAETSSSNGTKHYRDRLTKGIEPGRNTENRSADEAEGW